MSDQSADGPIDQPPTLVAVLPRAVIVLVAAAAMVVVIGGMRAATGILAPVFLALVLTIAVHPVQAFAQRRGWPPWAGTLLAILAVYSILVALTLALVVSLARFATLLPAYKDDAQDLVDDVTSRLSDFGVGTDEQAKLSSAFDLGKLTDFLLDLLGTIASLSSSLFFIITLLLFMGIDGSSFPTRARMVSSDHTPVVEALHTFAVGTRSYLIVSTVFGLIVAIIDTVALALLGVPAPLLWGLLAFITNYIPNIGFVIGLLPPAVLGLLEGGPSLMVIVIAIYCVVNFIIQSVIQPKFVGDAVGLSGTVSFLSLIFWAWVMGALGALLAIPLTLLAKALLIDSDPRARWVLPLMSGGPKNPDAEQQPTEGP